MGVGPPPAGALANFFHICFKEVGAEGAEEKNVKISDHSNSNSNRTKSLAAVEKKSKILEIVSAAVKGFRFFCRSFWKSKKQILSCSWKNSKILEFFSTAAKVSEIIAWQVAEWLVDKVDCEIKKNQKKGKIKNNGNFGFHFVKP